MDSVEGEPLKEHKSQDNSDDGPTEQSQLLQFPPVLLQKIASMLSDDGERLYLRDRIRFASVSRQMNSAVIGSIDRMERRRTVIVVEETRVQINDIIVKHQLSSGCAQMECIDALLAFSRPNDIFFYHDCANSAGDCLVAERILAAIPPHPVLQVDLCLSIGGCDEGTRFYGMMMSVAKMVNLEKLQIMYRVSGDHRSAAVHKNSSPSVPPGSPFLALLKLEKLSAFHLRARDLLTVAQRADLINRSASNLTHICHSHGHFRELLLFLNARTRRGISSVCCVDRVDVLALPDQLQMLVGHLPQCTDVSALCCGTLDRWTIDQVGGRLLESLIALGHKKKMVLRIGFSYDDWHLTNVGQTEFTYERNSNFVQVLLVGRAEIQENCPFNQKSKNTL